MDFAGIRVSPWMAALEAGGGMTKLLKEAEELSYLKITHDRIETTDKLEEKMALVTPAERTKKARPARKKRETAT